jgi:hypothetical protein
MRASLYKGDDDNMLQISYRMYRQRDAVYDAMWRFLRFHIFQMKFVCIVMYTVLSEYNCGLKYSVKRPHTKSNANLKHIQ